MWNVVVDDHTDVVDVDATSYDVRCYEKVNITCLKLAHHLFALLLCEVRVHLFDAY